MRTADADVERYLKLFTFLPLDQITILCDRHRADPSKRIAQHALAHEFVDLIHGAEAAKDAEKQHRALFQRSSLSNLTGGAAATKPQPPKTNPNTFNQNAGKREESTFVSRSLNKYAEPTHANNAPPAHLVLPRSLVYMQSIAKVLYSAGLVSSRSEGHRLAQNQGAYIGRRASGREEMSDDVSWVPAKLADPAQTWQNLIVDNPAAGTMEHEGEEGLLVLRSGKWKVRVVRVVSDEKFEREGFPHVPGWSEWKSMEAQKRAEGKGKAKKEEPVYLMDMEEQVEQRGTRREREEERAKSREKALKYFDEAGSQGRRER